MDLEAHRSAITLACVGLYAAVCLGIGVWAMRRTRTSRDFFVAGRDLGIVVSGVAIFSSTLSGFGFVGGPGLVYRMGMTSVWLVLTSITGYVLTFALLGKRLRLIAEVRDTVSLPDAVAARYDSETTRVLTAVAIVLGVLGYLATQILAMATVLRDVLGAAPGIAPVSLVACVAISCTVLAFYCVAGGIIASVYTDMFQGAIMVVAAILVFLAAQQSVEGGFAGMSTALLADDPESIGPWGSLGMLASLSYFFLFLLGTSGQPHVITKLMMIRQPTDAKSILPLTLAGYTLSALLWVSVGLAMRALVVQGAHPELAHADMTAPLFLQHYAHPLLAGIVFAGLFAAIMSTADAFLNIGVAAVVHDLPRALRGRAPRDELLWARVGTVVMTLVAAAFALYSHYANARLVALLGVFGAATFAAALVPVVSIGFNWKRATATAANVAIVASLVINLGIELLGVRLPWGIHGGVVAMLTSLTLFLGISLAQTAPRLAPDIEAAMDV
jgi:Na+/proline symporter